MSLTKRREIQEAEDALLRAETRLAESIKSLALLTEQVKPHETWLNTHIPPVECLAPLRELELENRSAKNPKDRKSLDPKIMKKVKAYLKEWESHTNSITTIKNQRSQIGIPVGSLKAQISNLKLKIERLKIENIPALRQFIEKRVTEYEARPKQEGMGDIPEIIQKPTKLPG